jgi:hypothetical protein
MTQLTPAPESLPASDTPPIDENVLDETEAEASSPTIYGISSYGADYTVELLSEENAFRRLFGTTISAILCLEYQESIGFC